MGTILTELLTSKGHIRFKSSNIHKNPCVDCRILLKHEHWLLTTAQCALAKRLWHSQTSWWTWTTSNIYRFLIYYQERPIIGLTGFFCTECGCPLCIVTRPNKSLGQSPPLGLKTTTTLSKPVILTGIFGWGMRASLGSKQQISLYNFPIDLASPPHPA